MVRCKGGPTCPMRRPVGKWHRHAEPTPTRKRRTLTPAECRFLGVPPGTTTLARRSKPRPEARAFSDLIRAALGKHGPAVAPVANLAGAILGQLYEVDTKRKAVQAAAGRKGKKAGAAGGRPRWVTDDDVLAKLATLDGRALQTAAERAARGAYFDLALKHPDKYDHAQAPPGLIERATRSIIRYVQYLKRGARKPRQ